MEYWNTGKMKKKGHSTGFGTAIIPLFQHSILPPHLDPFFQFLLTAEQA